MTEYTQSDFHAMTLQTYDCFFYGTLMVPAILDRVLGQHSSSITFQDAVLTDHTRHCVKAADYPGVISKADAEKLSGKTLDQEEGSVRGTLVKGLSARDVKALDVFEGSEYTRQIVGVYAIGEARPLKAASVKPREQLLVAELVKNSAQIPATTYIYTAGNERLEPAIWSLEDFLRDKADRWTGPSDEFDEVNEHHRSDLPELGRNMRQYWGFDKDYLALNNGSYGAPPLPVTQALSALGARIERNPDVFHKRDYLVLLGEVRRKVANLIKAEMDEVVMVTNTTHGIDLVVSNTVWEDGDIIVTYATTYNAVSQVAKHACDVNPNISLHVINLQFPMTHADIVKQTKEYIASINELSVDKPVGKGKQRVRMLIVDSISSNPGCIYPWRKLVQVCKMYGVLSVIDAAHEIGQREINVTSSGCDFWVSNCHKWLMAARSVAAVYVPRRNQHLIRTTFPTGASYESSRYPTEGMNRPWSFVKQFDWTGTVDWKSILSVTSALEFREFLGGEKRIQDYCHDLAVRGGQRMAEILGTETMENELGELTAAMTNVALPLPAAETLEDKVKLATNFQDRLFDKNAYGPVFWHNGKFWIRASAQVWNELEDFELFARKIQEVVQDLK